MADIVVNMGHYHAYSDIEVDMNEVWREMVGFKAWLRKLHQK